MLWGRPERGEASWFRRPRRGSVEWPWASRLEPKSGLVCYTVTSRLNQPDPHHMRLEREREYRRRTYGGCEYTTATRVAVVYRLVTHLRRSG